MQQLVDVRCIVELRNLFTARPTNMLPAAQNRDAEVQGITTPDLLLLDVL